MSFQSINENFCARSRKLGTHPEDGESEQSEDKSRDYAEAYCSTPHKESRRLTQRLCKKAIYGWKLDKYHEVGPIAQLEEPPAHNR